MPVLFSGYGIDVKQLLSQPSILTSPESSIRHQVNGILQKSHIKPKILMQTESILTATALAVQGAGITLSPENIIHDLQTIKNSSNIIFKVMICNLKIKNKKFKLSID